MKRIMKLIIFVFMFSLTINVYAENKIVKEGETEFNNFRTQYQKGIQKTTVNSTGTITLYGFSSCQSGSCAFTYANTSSDYKEVLKQAVVCGGGEKYIIYQNSGTADGYKSNNTENYVGEVYWSEDFSITCTNTSSSSTITLNNSTQQSTNQGSNNNESNGNYDSSSTTNNEAQGVETYYIILGIVGIITYFITIIVKKQNLFKKV